MKKIVQTPWLQPTQLLQVCTIIWLVAAQVIACLVQNVYDFNKIAVSVAAALALSIPVLIFHFMELKNWQTYLTLSLEIILVTVASITSLVAGFQLLLIITALKSGILLERSGFIATCIAATLSFTIFSQNNANTLVQSNSSNNDIVSLLFGREFVGFAVGMLLVVVLVNATRKEQQNRREAERLSEKLVSLATELERNRISRDINQVVDNLLEQVVGEVTEVGKALITTTATAASADANPHPSLKHARELAATALTEVRRSLALLRDFEIPT